MKVRYVIVRESDGKLETKENQIIKKNLPVINEKIKKTI